MEQLLALLNGIAPLTAPLQQHLKSALKRNVFKKWTYLLQSGHVSNSIHFIETGLVRCFYDKGDQEVCLWFMSVGDVIISVESFLLQQQSYQYIQAISECISWSITYAELQAIYFKYPEFNLHRADYWKSIMLKVKGGNGYYHIALYTELLNTNPQMLLQLPAKYIASYLNIDEAYFSKIKARYTG